jgi:hypothetical protein
MIGSWRDAVSISELNSFSPGLLEQSHLLRHYLTISPRYRALILGKELTIPGTSTAPPATVVLSQEEIAARLRVPGSKFVETFPDPDELCTELYFTIETAIRERGIRWIQQGTEEVSLFTQVYDEPIGFQGVVSLDSLDEETQGRVREESRGSTHGDGYTIQVVDAPLPMTDKLVIVLIKRNGVITLGSAYPGILTTAFPDRSWQSLEEYDFCRTAWSKLVFIKPPQGLTA